MSKHKHAYHIVIFKCITCDGIESIWNSADVELPIGIPCRVCQSMKRQINPKAGMLEFTGKAIPNVEYIPKRGERVIVEYNPEMSLLYNKIKAGVMWNYKPQGREPLSSNFKSPYDAAMEMQKIYKPGKPFIITL